MNRIFRSRCNSAGYPTLRARLIISFPRDDIAKYTMEVFTAIRPPLKCAGRTIQLLIMRTIT